LKRVGRSAGRSTGRQRVWGKIRERFTENVLREWFTVNGQSAAQPQVEWLQGLKALFFSSYFPAG